MVPILSVALFWSPLANTPLHWVRTQRAREQCPLPTRRTCFGEPGPRVLGPEVHLPGLAWTFHGWVPLLLGTSSGLWNSQGAADGGWCGGSLDSQAGISTWVLMRPFMMWTWFKVVREVGWTAGWGLGWNSAKSENNRFESGHQVIMKIYLLGRRKKHVSYNNFVSLI